MLGLDPVRDRTKLARETGAVFGQKSQLWFHLPPADPFRLPGAICEIEPAILARRRAELVERFGIGGFMDEPVRLAIPGLTPVKVNGDAGGGGAFTAASFKMDTRAHRMPEVIRALVDRGEVLDITVEDEPLENIIAAIHEARTGEAASLAARPKEAAR